MQIHDAMMEILKQACNGNLVWRIGQKVQNCPNITLNTIFRVAYCLDLHIAIVFFVTSDAIFYQVRMLMFYIVPTTNSTFVGRI